MNTGQLYAGDLDSRIQEALRTVAEERVFERLWRGDHTLWSDDPGEITEPNRLGWLHVVESIAGELGQLRDFAASVVAEGYRRVVVMGMGGSSLAPEVMHRIFGTSAGMLELDTLDSTHPEYVLGLTERLDLDRTLFVVASKSGTTIETQSHFDYFWEKRPQGRHYVAITDEGSPLHGLGEERGFRRVFLNRPDIGGRYSALSYFGLVPAALTGVDLEELLAGARAMAHACRTEAAGENPGALLGTVIGEAALAGRDKLTLLLPWELEALGDWIEQLLAESTGKDGTGVIPVVGETTAPPQSYGHDRLFVAIGEHTDLAGLEDAGHPVVRIPYEGKHQLGAELFRWQFATAVAGQRLRINPFDQPNVQAAKDATSRLLDGGTPPGETPALADVLSTVKQGDYIALLAYLPPNRHIRMRLQSLRLELRDYYLVATTAGFGPRYLHSTGQLHKGGPNSGVFIVLTDRANQDAPIPERSYTFDGLRRAQAMGDLELLAARGRRVTHIELQGEVADSLKALQEGSGALGPGPIHPGSA